MSMIVYRRLTNYLVADVFEAYVGGVFVENGFEFTRSWLVELLFV